MTSLLAFNNTGTAASFKVQAELFQVSPHTLLIEFKLLGPLEQVVWPSPGVIETREDGLWKTTCLEAFLSSGDKKNDPYFEINCSPNGNWNAYSFGSYRDGMTPSPDITVRLKERSTEANEAHFQIEIQNSSPWEIKFYGLTAVIEFSNGEKSYWALRHPGSAADFHDKAGWHPLATR
ncbi:MAG: DOMON-like domain-containing protein [Bdellovibrio sp.]|nr:DOMON-like domain-containing protein [Bdellovibrio sp.]